VSEQHAILIVDDDQGFRKTLTDILKLKGYVPIAVDKGETALTCLKEEDFRVALIDLKLGNMSGLDLLKEIKNLFEGIECILLTGYASQSSAIEAVNLGAYGYLQKPYNIEQLLVMIRRAIEKQDAETALRASEERFRQVVVSISDHIYVSEVDDGENFKNLYLSPNIETLTGYSQDNFIADWHFWSSSLIHPEDRDKATAQVAKLANGQDSETEYRLLRADGQIIWVRDSARVHSQETSKIIYGVVSNITQRHQLEEQLLQAQKMEAIGRLAGGIAHDFNNILTVILSSCDFALDAFDGNDPIRKDIEQIKKAGERAATLTRQLLAFSRKQVPQLKVLDLNNIITGMEKMLRPLIGEDINLITELTPDSKPIKADPGHLEQILLNLVINARDAMPQGGELVIETASVYLDEAYARRHVDITAGPYMMLAVTDTGIGMDEQTQAHIFEPFFTTKEVGKGTGLGLATIYGIVKLSQGHIMVYSEPEYGTTFKVYFPQVDENLGLTESDQIPALPLQRPKTILLVEDEDMVRNLSHRILANSGYTVLEASTGADAIQLVAGYSGRIELLLTDVVMPDGLGGRELAEKLMVLYPKIKVLYMSGYTDDAIVRHGVLETGTAFLQKPFTPTALLNKVREIFDDI
jgi:two-component system cell cycle sensor histidine kinase/response regulator CckA